MAASHPTHTSTHLSRKDRFGIGRGPPRFNGADLADAKKTSNGIPAVLAGQLSSRATFRVAKDGIEDDFDTIGQRCIVATSHLHPDPIPGSWPTRCGSTSARYYGARPKKRTSSACLTLALHHPRRLADTRLEVEASSQARKSARTVGHHRRT